MSGPTVTCLLHVNELIGAAALQIHAVARRWHLHLHLPAQHLHCAHVAGQRHWLLARLQHHPIHGRRQALQSLCQVLPMLKILVKAC